MLATHLLRLDRQSTTAYFEKLGGTVGVNVNTLFGYIDILLLLFYRPSESLILTWDSLVLEYAANGYMWQCYTQHTIILLLFWNLSGTNRVTKYQKGKNQEGKTNLDLLEQEIVSGSGICWSLCKSAPHPR